MRGTFALCTVLALLQSPAHAWLEPVPGTTYAFDATTSLQWLRLTETLNLSHNQVGVPGARHKPLIGLGLTAGGFVLMVAVVTAFSLLEPPSP